MTTISGTAALQRRLIVPAAISTVFVALHHLDHAFRRVHIGWPLTDNVNPFTFSFVLYLLLLPGIYLTARGQVWAGYWLSVAIFGFSLVTFVHFRPSPSAESLDQVYYPWNNPILGGIAVAVLFALELSLVALLVAAIRVRVLSGRW